MAENLATLAEAALHLRNKRLRGNLVDWCRHCGFEPAAHHVLLLEKLQAVSRGDLDRLAVFMPPGAAKSTYSSILFPPWFFAQKPDACLIAASHTQELAEKWGRRVRNLIGEFPQVLGYGLSADNQAAGRWETSAGGEYFASGVGGAIAGRRADLVVIDDPVRSREDADSEVVRDKVWDWYKSDLYTRLKPGGKIILIQCMTGDTPVMLADGSERPLRDIRPGDAVATFKNGLLAKSVVRKWANNGIDRVFAIKTTSGITVRANERHPFLVCEDGEQKWIRTRDLRLGHAIVRVNGASGKVKPALGRTAKSQPSVAAIACRTTTKSDGLTAFDHLRQTLDRSVRHISNIVMGWLPVSTSACTPNRMAYALSADNHPERMFAPIGAANFASITVTTRQVFAGFSATTAISRSDMQKHRKSPSPSQNTCDFILDQILEINDAGVEEVFDIQIADTENFIANGLVSHNTRWHEDDLAGRILEDMKSGGDQWEVISLPAIAEGRDDPLGRLPGEALWPEWENLSELERKRRAVGPRDWSALYQQRPAPEEGDYFRAEWLKTYTKAPPLETLAVYGGSDYAVTSDGGDYTVHAVIGVDPEKRMYLLDLWRKQASSDVWIEAFCSMVREYKPREWAEEHGQIKSGVGPFIDRMQRERNAYVYRRVFPTRGDKSVRAQSIRGRMAIDGLYVPQNAPWLAELRSELLSFPAGKHDDIVDALGLIGQLLDYMTEGMPIPEPEKKNKNTSGYELIDLGGFRDNDWIAY